MKAPFEWEMHNDDADGPLRAAALTAHLVPQIRVVLYLLYLPTLLLLTTD